MGGVDVRKGKRKWHNYLISNHRSITLPVTEYEVRTIKL